MVSYQPHRLVGKERKYLQDGVAEGTYRPHELEQRATDKVELLPERFERLFEDIELLTRRSEKKPNLLATDTALHAWFELLGLGEQPTRREVEEALSPGLGGSGSAVAEFGADLGATVDRINRWPEYGSIQNEEIVAEFVWGFLRGLQFDRRLAKDVDTDRVREDVSQILDLVEERAEGHAESIGFDSPPQYLVQLELRRLRRREMASRVQELLGADGPAPDAELGTELQVGKDGRFYYDVVAHIIDRATDGEHDIDTNAQHSVFWDQYGPLESFDADEFLRPEQVESIIEDRRLLEKHDLKQQLSQDARVLADKGAKGAAAQKILPVLVEDGPKSSADLAESVDEATSSVTRLARDLAGVDCRSRNQRGIDVWVERPILDGSRDEWEITAYGEAATFALQKHLAAQDEIFRPKAVSRYPDELLERALEQVSCN